MEPKKDVQPLLNVEKLSVRYAHAERFAVHDVSFQLREGEQVAIVGESGSGKSTLSRAIAGFITKSIGSVDFANLTLDGKDIRQRSKSRLPYRVPGISMVFQDAMTSLDPVYRIREQFVTALEGVEGTRKKELIAEIPSWLDAVGLRETKRVLDSRPAELSGGMRQRVMLALALASRPKLLIADEPTSALDAELALEVMDLLAGLSKERGATLLIISHDIALCRAYCDRLLVMLDGKLVDDCTSEEVLARERSTYTRALVRSVPDLTMAQWESLPTIDLREMEDARAKIH